MAQMAQLYATCADATMGLAGKMEPDSEERIGYVKQASHWIDHASKGQSVSSSRSESCVLICHIQLINALARLGEGRR